jgi:hypothetical protein
MGEREATIQSAEQQAGEACEGGHQRYLLRTGRSRDDGVRRGHLHYAPDADKGVYFLHDPAITYVAGPSL